MLDKDNYLYSYIGHEIGLVQLTLLIWWILGVVVTSGFWSTSFAIFFPPYAWYLGLEWVVGFFPSQS